MIMIMTISHFFHIFKGYRCNNTKDYFLWGPKKINVNFHKNCETQVKCLFYEISRLFSQALIRNFLWCYYRQLITSVAFEKAEKECNIVEIILVQGFGPLKIKITQFPDGFILYTQCLKATPSWLKHTFVLIL